MTSIPTTPSAASMLPRPAMPGVSHPAAPASAVDPFKLLNRHKWRLVIAAVLGAVLGVGGHYAALKFYPIWRPIQLFRCLPPQADIKADSGITANVDEMTKFMQTQARLMTQDAVLARVAESPEIQSEAKKWCSQYYKTDKDGREIFNSSDALDDLRDWVRARVVPQTFLIELSMGWHEKEDATTILRLVGNIYQKVIKDEGDDANRDKVQALRDSINRQEQESESLRRKREMLIREGKVGGTLSERSEATLNELTEVNQKLLGFQADQQRMDQEVRSLESKLQAEGGVSFPDEMIADAERDFQVAEANRTVRDFETAKQALIREGYALTHRKVLEADSRLAAAQELQKTAQQRAVRKIFDSRLDEAKRAQSGLAAQVSEFVGKRDILTSRMQDLKRFTDQIEDTTRRIDAIQNQMASTNANLQEVIGRGQLATANRVVVIQPARLPNEIAFPRLAYMIPGGIVLLTLLVGGITLIREIVDQRIKSPADIGLIPRTRLLGWVPDAAEDPEGEGPVETVFRDRAQGIVAESYRQIRSMLNKRMQAAGHRTVVVLSGMPGSGATSTVANLALAFAAAEQRVLVIDANFRRPAVHRVFGIPDAPGLADVLARDSGTTVPLADAVRNTGTPKLDVLTAGTKDRRFVERLSTDAMTDLLTAARARYDVVLLDVAPAVVSGDGLALAGRCDASLLVVRAFGEKRGMVARIRNELSEARGEFLGVIVNAVRASSGGYLKGNIRTAAEYHRD